MQTHCVQAKKTTQKPYLITTHTVKQVPNNSMPSRTGIEPLFQTLQEVLMEANQRLQMAWKEQPRKKPSGEMRRQNHFQYNPYLKSLGATTVSRAGINKDNKISIEFR